MLWFINEVSLQGQFDTADAFELALGELLAARRRHRQLMLALRVTPLLSMRLVIPGASLQSILSRSRRRDLRVEALTWLDRAGPFIEDSRAPEIDDYFEIFGIDVTDGGLGEASRQIKAGTRAGAFSFPGGEVDFSSSPLYVTHGLPEDPKAIVAVENFWTIENLGNAASETVPLPSSWPDLIFYARDRFSHLVLPDSIYSNDSLAREPFDPIIRDRALVLLGYLDQYMSARLVDGSEGPSARDIINRFFVGDRALFTGESPTKQREYLDQLTFKNPTHSGEHIFAHWHGKISRRFFRLHFEWPLKPSQDKLTVVYLGPKITKD